MYIPVWKSVIVAPGSVGAIFLAPPLGLAGQLSNSFELHLDACGFFATPIFIFQPSSLPLWHPDVSSGIHKDSPEGIWRCAWVVDQDVMEENSGPDASPMQVTFFTARTPGRSQYM